jgi:hypothetical protein
LLEALTTDRGKLLTITNLAYRQSIGRGNDSIVVVGIGSGGLRLFFAKVGQLGLSLRFSLSI